MTRTGPHEGATSVAPAELVSFLCELAMVALLAVAGWRLGSGTASSLIAAIGLPLLAITLWGLVFAPRARRRLAQPARLAGQGLVFVCAGVLAALVGLPWWGLLVAVAGCAAFAVVARKETWSQSQPGGV